MSAQCWFTGMILSLPVVSHAAHAATGPGRKVRTPAVQGQFYPGDREELAKAVDGYLAQAPPHMASARVRALICPHAGYVYSGVVAAAGFQQIPQDTERVIVMAPSHHVALRGGGSILEVDAYRNALGEIPLDPEAAELRRRHRFFGAAPTAHAREHSLEVMLPFLQRVLKRPFTLIPIVLGRDFDAAAMAKAILPLVQDPKTLIVASSDLSHDQPYNAAVRLDRDCLETILRLDAEAVVTKELCGKYPAAVLIHLAKLQGWKPELIDYRNSGDTTGDTQGRIVGYGCVAFVDSPDSRPAPEEAPAEVPATAEQGRTPEVEKEPAAQDEKHELLTVDEQKALLALARQTVTAALAKEPLPDLPAGPALFAQKLGCFVTLHKKGQLRGCIGNIFPTHVLAKAVQQNALSSAFKDTRFTSVKAQEMADIDIEISVLTTPATLAYRDADDLLSKLKPRVHGVVLTQGVFRRSTYLPQVWEQIPDKVQFLSHLCRKGGMDAAAWKDPRQTKVEVYQAFVFGEKELGMLPK